MSQTPDARDELIGELSRAIFLVDQATVPKGKAPHEAPDQVVGSLVIGGRLYQRILDAARHATNSGVERDTLAGIRNGLIAARMLLEDAGHWKNPSGYLTDAAMWIERALNEAHESDESMTNQVRSTDAAQVVGDKSRDEQKGLPMNPPTPEDLNRMREVAEKAQVDANAAVDFLDSVSPKLVLLLIEEIERLGAMNANLVATQGEELARIGVARECEQAEALSALTSKDEEIERLKAKLNSPELHDFAAGVILEAAHQRERWAAPHDAGKQPEDWFWLLGYLGGKALSAAKSGDTDKALHHTISTAAALANWHAALSQTNTDMRPGIDPVERGIS